MALVCDLGSRGIGCCSCVSIWLLLLFVESGYGGGFSVSKKCLKGLGRSHSSSDQAIKVDL